MTSPVFRWQLYIVIAPQIPPNPNVVASTGTLKRRDSFSALSTVVELQEETDDDTKSEAKLEATMVSKPDTFSVKTDTFSSHDNDQFDLTVNFISEAPPSLLPEDSICEAMPSIMSVDSSTLAPESLFSHSESAEMELPEAPVEVPPMLIPAKNPKLYQLVQMSSESSFWWDSTDSSNPDGAIGSPGSGQNFGASFDSYDETVTYTNDEDAVHDGNAKKGQI